MAENNMKQNYPLIAGGFFALYAFIRLISFLDTLKYIRYLAVTSILSSILAIAGAALAAVALFTKRKNVILPAAMALIALSCLLVIRNIMGFILNLIRIVGLLFGAAFCAVYTTDYLPQYKQQVKTFWFFPGAAIAAGSVLGFFTRLLGAGYNLHGVFHGIVLAGGVLLAVLWAADMEMEMPVMEGGAKPAASAAPAVKTAPVAESEMYCGLVKHILLLIFTFGIWLLIWTYRVTGYTNNIEGEEDRNPTTKLLLCLFVPFYSIYWTYKTAQRIDKMAANKGIASDLGTLCLILAIFVGIIPPILMQDKLNAIAALPTQAAANGAAERVTVQREPEQAAAAEAPQKTTQETVEELKAFKGLLDSGVITQEEFDAKKKQILGL